VLAYHPSSYNDTYRMTSLLKDGDPAKAAARATAEKKAHAKSAADLAGDPPQATAEGIWIGSALNLWRTGRSGGAYTAIDCGASPGTPVCSPLDGTVMEIRSYKLYGKYQDIEIDIKPDAFSDVDVILLHVTDPTVTEGQHVIGGVTPIAHVRHISNIVPGLQLRTYSPDGGNHTHLQLTRIPDPGRPWVLGEDPPGMVRLAN
jgi:murein DD-endopeptidase MepM/ murein hydrolase activator NlpD